MLFQMNGVKIIEWMLHKRLHCTAIVCMSD